MLKRKLSFYDVEKNTEIYIDPISAESHVRGKVWVNILKYQNVDFDNAKSICVKASAVVSEKKIAVFIDDCKEPVCELTVPASDGYTDFRELTAELDISGCHDLTLSFGENLSISTIKLNK